MITLQWAIYVFIFAFFHQSEGTALFHLLLDADSSAWLVVTPNKYFKFIEQTTPNTVLQVTKYIHIYCFI